MSTREELDKKINESFTRLRTSISWANLTRDEIEFRVKNILENETKDIQLIAQLKYLEWLSPDEISSITNKSLFEVYSFLDYIISRIWRVIRKEEQWSVKKEERNIISPNKLDIKI